MRLDLVTIYTVMAFALLATGIVQILSLMIPRFGRWPAWWGVSNLLIGSGTLLLADHDLRPGAIIIILADLLTVIGYAMLFVGVRSFAARSALRGAVLPAAVGVVATLALADPTAFSIRIAILSFLYGFWDVAIAIEGYRLRRTEELRSGWFLILAFAPTAMLFFVRAVLALGNHLGQAGVAAVNSSAHALLAVSAVAFVMVRNMSLFMLAAERGQNSLIRRAQTDALTGAYNRAGLLEQVQHLAIETGAIAVLAVDIDHFKRLNDTYGHAAGDEILRNVRSCAAEALRDGDLLGRWGGDEFVLILPQAEAGVAMAIAKNLQARFATTSGRTETTLSIGCAVGTLKDADFLPILHRADEALYASKRLGRDRVTLADGLQHQGASAKYNAM